MDFLRSCYKQRISYVKGNPGITALATWYFAAPTALPFPSHHSFGSPTWDSEHPGITTLGFDATGPRTYYNGKRLNRSDGTTYAGPLICFKEGTDSPANLPRGRDATPIECLDPPFGILTGGSGLYALPGRGGLLTGGQGVPLPSGVACVNCPGFTPLTVSVTLSGFSGVYAVYNGAHTLTQTVSPCIWTVSLGGTKTITAVRGAGNAWNVFLTAAPTAAQYTGTAPDCLTGATLSLVFSFIGGSATASLSIP